ncbi:hypothetical protein F4679DRAFT_600204 [Xylaria curta]|nr:hypothetical protein F4679DRAFT_600204 [Xylaria curta]
MASYPLIGVLTNPYQLVTLLLGVASCLLTLTTLPPSSVIYLIRADYRSHGDNAATQTAWLGTLGYCATDASNEILHSNNIKCSGTVVGYDMTKALEQVHTIPEVSISSISLTKGSVVLNPIAIALCLLSIAAFQAIRCRPKGLIYAIAMGGNILALLISGIAFIFEYSLITFIAGGYLAADATLITTSGPLVYATVLALGFQLAACVVGFYTCIGGKYDCEGGIRLEEVQSNSTTNCRLPPDEKCPL